MSTSGADGRELSDFAAPWAVWIAATLRSFRPYRGGPTGCRPGRSRGRGSRCPERLLTYLVARGVFTRDVGGYANTEISRLLIDEVGWRRWLDLDSAPESGRSRGARAARSRSRGITRPRSRIGYLRELARTGGSLVRLADGGAARGPTPRRSQSSTTGARRRDVVDGRWRHRTHAANAPPSASQRARHVIDLPQVVGGIEPAERLTIVAGNVFHDPLSAGRRVRLLAGSSRRANKGAAKILHQWRRSRPRRRTGPDHRKPHLRAAICRRGKLRPLHAHAQRRPSAGRWMTSGAWRSR